MPIFPVLFAVSLGLALFVLDSAPMLSLLSEDGSVAASALPSLSTALRRRRGRPRKFEAPSRAVTLTLPEAIIAKLSAIHEDLSRAVVGLMQRQSPVRTRQAAELLVFGRRAVITIRPTPSLERRTGVQLVPMPDGRALISFDTPQSLAELELTINDALDDRALSRDDRTVYEGISAILKEARRSKTVSLHRRNIIVLESIARPTPANGTKPSQARRNHSSRTAVTAR
jgi:hypothetical protein